MTLPTRTSWSESPTLAVDAAPPPAAVDAFFPVLAGRGCGAALPAAVLLLEDLQDLRGDVAGLGVHDLVDPELLLTAGHVELFQEVEQLAEVRTGLGDDQRVAGLVYDEGGVGGGHLAQDVVHVLGVDVLERHDLRDHAVFVGRRRTGRPQRIRAVGIVLDVDDLEELAALAERLAVGLEGRQERPVRLVRRDGGGGVDGDLPGHVFADDDVLARHAGDHLHHAAELLLVDVQVELHVRLELLAVVDEVLAQRRGAGGGALLLLPLGRVARAAGVAGRAAAARGPRRRPSGGCPAAADVARALGASSASPARRLLPDLAVGFARDAPGLERGMSGRPTPAAKGAGLTVGTPVWACAGCEERAPATNSTARAVIAEKRRSFMALGCTSVTGSCNRARSGARGVRSRGSRWRSSSASRTSPGPCWGWRSRPR
jgi:hypothetical protein